MNARWLTTLSLLLNVALVVLGWRIDSKPDAANAAAVPVARRAAAAETLSLLTNVTRLNVTETNQAAPFHWREVQSEDLRAFTDNLRGVGCPPETIRTIIESELRARFLLRRRVLLEPIQQKYWDLATTDPGLEKVSERFRPSVDKLREETLGKLDEIVGKPAASPMKQARNRQTDFLSETKQRELEDLEKHFNDEMATLRPEEPRKTTPELQAKQEELRARHQAAIRASMTLDELAEYDLRGSRYASVTQSAIGFDATPEEMRAVTRIYQQFQTADARPDGKDPNAATKKAQAEEASKQRETALKESLPPERYALFQEGLDGTFQQVYRITERYELPRELATAAAGVLRTSEERLKLLLKEGAPPTPETAQRRVAIQAETRDELLRVMGERVLRTYEKYQGPINPTPEGIEAR